jgi:hypothetical protein
MASMSEESTTPLARIMRRVRWLYRATMTLAILLTATAIALNDIVFDVAAIVVMAAGAGVLYIVAQAMRQGGWS